MSKRFAAAIAIAIVLSSSLAGTAFARSADADSHFGTAGIASIALPSPILPAGVPIVVDQRNRVLFGVSTADDDLIGALDANGTIDATFGSSGYIALDQYLSDLAIDAHNRIVVLQTDDSAASLGIRLTRYLENGALDTSFGSGGYVMLHSPSEDLVPSALALDGDDVVVVGTEVSEPTTGDSRILVARFDSAGTPDLTFGVRGTRFLSLLPAGTEQSYGKAVAVGSDGKIVVTGYTTIASRIIVDDIVKLTRGGILDPSFGHGAGFVQTDAELSEPAPRYTFSESVAIDSRDNIVTAGFAGTWSDFTSSVVVARYEPDGAFDATFNGGSPKLINADASTSGHGATVLLDGRDRIVIGGVVAKNVAAANQLAVFRLNDDGSADTTLGDHSGYQLLSTHSDGGRCAFAHGGDIVVAGNRDDGSALVIEERIGYDLPPIMPPTHF